MGWVYELFPILIKRRKQLAGTLLVENSRCYPSEERISLSTEDFASG